MWSVLSSAAGVRGPLADAEDHELRRLDRRHADEADEAPIVQVVLRHRRAIAAHEVRLLRPLAEQRAVAPLDFEEVLDGLRDVGPEAVAVGLEHCPLRGL